MKKLIVAVVLFPSIALAGGTSNDSDSLPADLLKRMQQADAVTIPSSCDAPRMAVDMQTQVPSVLKLPPGAATVSGVTDIRQVLVTNEKIICQGIFQWSNGLVEKGQFSEWIDNYGETMVAYKSLLVIDPPNN